MLTSWLGLKGLIGKARVHLNVFFLKFTFARIGNDMIKFVAPCGGKEIIN